MNQGKNRFRRRRQLRHDDTATIIGCAVLLAATWFLLRHGIIDLPAGWSHKAATIFGAVLFLIIVGAVYAMAARRRIYRETLRKCEAIINHNMPTLIRRHKILVQQDAYGKAPLDKWEKEIDHFLMNNVFPTLVGKEQLVFWQTRSELLRDITRRAGEGNHSAKLIQQQ